MKSRALIITLTVFLFLQQLHAQMPLPEIPYIEVNGTAEKEITPDRLYLGILIQERVSGKDKVSIQEQEEKMKKGLSKAGISLENLYLADANADYTRSRWKSAEVISRKQFELRLSTADEVSRAFKVLDEIEITDAWISKIDHSKLEEFKKELRIEAIKTAKSKSDYLLTAIGQQTGKALIVRENDYGYQMPMYRNKNMEMAAMADTGGMAESESPDFRKIKLTSSVYVKFEIK